MKTVLALCLAAPLALSGCVSTAAIDDTATKVVDSRQFRAVCSAEPFAYAAFIAAAGDDVGPKTRRRVADAHAVVTATCRTPPRDLVSALATIADAYALILEAREATEV